MLRIAVQFLSGRYHATPWGCHVNEGKVEWPPSPWRLCRALIATGFAKLGWSDVPRDARATIELLAARPPVYHLPAARAAHTRHYMPRYRDKSDKVIDTFAYPGRDLPLVIDWDVEPDPSQTELIDRLFRAMGYLGRAESWIEAQRIDELPAGLRRCAPTETGMSAPPPDTAEYERVELLAPMAPDEYGVWRQDILAHEQTRRLADKQQTARMKAAKKIPKSLAARERAALRDELPESLLDALRIETADLQKAGWSQPPGSRWLTYLRPRYALDSVPSRRPHRAARERPDTALLALLPDTTRARILPPMRDALARCDMLHRALVSKASNGHGEYALPCLTGKDADGHLLEGHQHATLIPLDLEAPRDHIDHVAVYAPMGLDRRAVTALREVKKTYAKNHPGLFVTLLAMGRREDFGADIPQFAESRVWVSATPFVPPRYLKPSGKNCLVGQIRAELLSRGIDESIESIEIEVETDDQGQRGYRSAEEFWRIWRRSRGHRVGVTLRDPNELTTGEPSSGVAAAPASEPITILARHWRRFRRIRKSTPARIDAGTDTGGTGHRALKASRPPQAAALGLRIMFAHPVRGPITLGYASHFGLGSFVAEPASCSGGLGR